MAIFAHRLQVSVDDIEALAPLDRFCQGDMDDLVPRVGDDPTGLGIAALEEVVVAFGVSDEHGWGSLSNNELEGYASW